MLRSIRDKRGDIAQLPLLVVLLLVIALVGLIVGFIAYKITDAWKSTPDINNSVLAKNANENFHETIPTITDTAVLIAFLGFTIALCVAAVRTNFNIVVLGLFFILLLLSVFIAAGAANIYHGFAASTEIEGFSVKLVFSQILFSKYTPLIIVLIGAVLLIIMYGKSGSNIPI